MLEDEICPDEIEIWQVRRRKEPTGCCGPPVRFKDSFSLGWAGFGGRLDRFDDIGLGSRFVTFDYDLCLGPRRSLVLGRLKIAPLEGRLLCDWLNWGGQLLVLGRGRLVVGLLLVVAHFLSLSVLRF